MLSAEEGGEEEEAEGKGCACAVFNAWRTFAESPLRPPFRRARREVQLRSDSVQLLHGFPPEHFTFLRRQASQASLVTPDLGAIRTLVYQLKEDRKTAKRLARIRD